MTRSKLSLKNLVKAARNILFITCLIAGCASSITPTYTKEEITTAIQDIVKSEYKLDVKAKLVGSTLWIYIPVEDLIVKSDKPEKYIERFAIEQNKSEFNDDSLKLAYLIKAVPEKEMYQEYKYNKDVLAKTNHIWTVLRRVIFSIERLKKDEPKFYYLITADIKNGFEIKELSYYLDLKKVSYEFISFGEYQHRSIQDVNIAPEIVGDKEGAHLNYKDITLEDFIIEQIKHRIKLKFQKPEVDKNVDIDKEIIKVAVYTIKTYGFRDFSEVELDNLVTQNKIILNRAAVWARPME